MSPRNIVALLQRHLIAVALVFIVAAGLGYHLEHANPGYVDTATVAFTAPKGQANLFNYGQGLLVIDALTTNSVMSPNGQQQVKNVGGTTSYDVALVNLNDEDYPNYSYPYVTVTTTSLDAAAAQKTFSAVMDVLQQNLVMMQARQGARPKFWIQLRTIAAPSGPVAQSGSRKRSLAGLAVLTLIAMYMTATFLDRYRFRLRELIRKEDQRDIVVHHWTTMRTRPRT